MTAPRRAALAGGTPWDAQAVTLKPENRFDPQIIDQMRGDCTVTMGTRRSDRIPMASSRERRILVVMAWPWGSKEKMPERGQCSGSRPERLGRRFFRAVHSELGGCLLDRGERQTQTLGDRFVGQPPAIDVETRSKVRIFKNSSKSLARQR